MPYHIQELSATESVAVFRALASESRARIIELLAERDMNINELSTALGLAQPSITKHIQILEEAGLVESDYLAGPQGTQKRCRRVHDRLLIEMAGRPYRPDCVSEIEVPVGMYTQIEAVPTCGLANRERFIGHLDNPVSFFLPERATAELIWSAGGFVEYVFTNSLPLEASVVGVDLAMEICSEAPGYNNDYPSDITVWLNGFEIGTWSSPGDFGGTRGRLNPNWWHDNLNQFGLLKVWQVNNHGTSIDGMIISPVKIDDLGIRPWQTIRVRIGVKPESPNQGGFTLFGKGFGNYEQDLVLRLHYV
ncbi:regulatory protein ArsR [Fimbriimonas ginsengisoli Gsoil 348]|uniref:Regulatory protein ArsR n=2 Tax=Fimbriimonas ginsengisoli TaxID=1005039 RepID=A0A068NUD9_FIMGI|nr:regulatory protein ArsR [Fimbriimonas ginsengisoli Gsoil 348]